MADSVVASSGISRRRIIQGAVWATPAIVIATSAPARAASLPADQGVTIQSMYVNYQAYHWNASQGTGQPAVIVQANVHNAPAPAPDPSPIVTLQVSFQVPVGAIANPAWGLGQGGAPNREGIAAGAPWALASPVSVSAGIATLTFSYTGDAIPHYDNRQPTVWVQVASSQLGAAAIVTAFATHENGNSSSDVAAGIAVLIADDPPGGL